ncbi:MAG: hypothetical protein OEY52_06180 [Gammaproteobacteria bacterium]|nr:hypothetical protein [Gammaproteobacteria bacterium]
MMIRHIFRVTIGILLAGLVFTFAACSSDDAAKPSAGTNQSYSGPGSKWDVALKADGTFSIDKYANAAATTADFSVTGTYTTLTSGFKKLTVGTVTGTGGPSKGDIAYALEVPGFMLALKPAGGGTQLIPMVASGTCPSSDMNLNWVKVNVGDGVSNFTTADLGGTFSYTAATGAAVLPAKYNISGGDAGTNVSVGNGTCNLGIMSIDPVEMYLTSAGGAVVNTDKTNSANSEFIFGFGQKAITDVASLNGNYVGIRFKQNGNSLEPVDVSCTNGVCSGKGYTNIETGETMTGGVTLTLGTPDSPSTGFILGTVTENSQTGNFICMFDKNAAGSGKIIGNCAGTEAGDNTKWSNVLFVSK